MPKRPLPNDIDDKMLDAVIDISARYGVGKVTTLKVADACGVAEITVYRHFESKQNLLYQAFLRFNERITAVATAEKQGSLDMGVHLRNVWTRTFDFLIGCPKELAFYNEYIHTPYYNRDQDPRLGSANDILYRWSLYGNPSLSRMTGMGPEIVWTYTVQATLVFAEKIAKGEIRDTVQIREYLFYLLFGNIVRGFASRAAFAEVE